MENPEITELLSDIQSEYKLLGEVFVNNQILAAVSFLELEDFHSQQHQRVFAAMRELYAKGEGISPFTILPLVGNAEFEDAGGVMKYLSGALIQAPGHFTAVHIANHLRSLSQKRHIGKACQGIIKNIQDENPIQQASQLGKLAEEIMRQTSAYEFQDDYEVCEEVLRDLQDERRPDSTGFKRLDECMGGGLFAGKSYGFAAKKKMGKTTLAGTISCNLAERGVKHLFICGEMSPKEIEQRKMARLTESYASAFRNSYGETSTFQKKFIEEMRKSKRVTLYRNAPGLTFDELKRICTMATERHSIKGFILDYWQLVGGKGKSQSTAEHLDEVSQWIADFCRKKGIWSITMAQINQEGNTRGGEGMRLAFDQVYQLKAREDDPSMSGRHLDMMDTRYTEWKNIGDENTPGYLMNPHGPYFEEQEKLR